MRTRSLLTAVLFLAAAPARAQDAAPSPEQLAFFEKKIQPVLVEKCYKCHSEKAEKIKGGLVLDTREGIRRGGDNGPAVVPGDLAESLVVEALRYTNKDFAMPPEKSGGKLSDEIIKDFETWIKMGAADPRSGAAKVVKKYDADEARKWWSFQPIVKPAVPQPALAGWAKNDLDRLVLAGLETKGLRPVADADKTTLIRRIYFDLIGLPPTPKEIDTFLKDTSADAFAKVVDRLLGSPQYGERWGRHWLDVARYAESSGKDVNIAFPNAWRYRDYVVAAFNADKPFDQFVREQIAGDLLPARDDQQRAEQIVATGFLALGPKGLNEQNPRQFMLDLVDEQIDTVSQAILGVTVACARCHDHKFDPVPQHEYYALAGIFLSTDTRYGTTRGFQNRHSSDLIALPKGAAAPVLGQKMNPEERKRKELQVEELKKEQQQFLAQRFRQRQDPAPGENNPQRPSQTQQQRALQLAAQLDRLEMELKYVDEYGYPKALAMGTVDLPASPSNRGSEGRGFNQRMQNRLRDRFGGRPPEFASIGNSPLYARGEVDKPGSKVPRALPGLMRADQTIPESSSGRRELADALVGESNPLTSRVMANRVWHWLFGDGIVESTDNFGTTGQKPSNQALLDHLATRLTDNQWSIKKLIREIVLSRTYQLGSAFDGKNFTADPENALVWRMSKKRLDAECVRDAILSVSGQLDLNASVGSLIAREGEGPIGGPPRLGGIVEEKIIGAAGNQRSLYLPVARDVLPDALAVFDFPEPSLVTGARETTNVPAQALYMLNSSFVGTQAEKMAERIMAGYPGGPNAGVAMNLDQRLVYAYWLAFSRAPDQAERQAASNFFARFPSNWSKGDKSSAGMRDASDIKAAWTSFCRALFASAEFRYLN